MQKVDLNMHAFQNRNWCSLKSDHCFFSLTVKETFHTKDFNWKKIRGYRVTFSKKKRRLCIQNLRKERKEPPVVILQQVIFYNIFILCLWLRMVRRSDQGSWTFLHRYFSTILIIVTKQLYWRKILFGCFHFEWLWLLIAITKRCAKRCALQLYHTSLKNCSRGINQ